MKNCVYRFLDANRNVLYIGKTQDLKTRIANHNHLPRKCYEQRKFIEYIELPTVEDMNIMERALIAMVKPPYNTEFKQNNITLHITELSNLKWKRYDIEDKNKFSSIGELRDGLYLVQVIHGKPYMVGSVNGLTSTTSNNTDNIDEFDELLEESVEVVINHQASASLLQRYLKIGFNRAARILEQLEQLGIVGEPRGCKVREVLVTDIEQAKQKIKKSSDISLI